VCVRVDEHLPPVISLCRAALVRWNRALIAQGSTLPVGTKLEMVLPEGSPEVRLGPSPHCHAVAV